MRLTRLEARDFLSYEDLTLDLSDVSQVVVVGQNGHGKSALLDAILWCLYGVGRGSADQMVRHGALSSSVRLTMSIGGREVVVARGRSKETKAGESSLTLEIDGQRITRHTIAETQEAIEKAIGLPAHALMAGPFMVQGNSDTLMRARPAERKDLLIRLLDLERYERYHEAARGARDTLHAKVVQIEGRMADAELQLGAREGVDAELESARTTEVAARAEVATLTERVATLREEAVRADERSKRLRTLDAEVAAANRRVDEWTKFVAQAEQQYEEQRERAEAVLEEPSYERTDDLDDLISMVRVSVEDDDAAVTAAITAATARAKLRSERDRIAGILRTREERGVCSTCPFVEQADPEQLRILNEQLHGEDPDVDAAREKARTSRTRLSEYERDRAALVHRNEVKQKGFEQLASFKDLATQMMAQTLARIDQLRSSIVSENERVATLTAERLRMDEEDDLDTIAADLAAATTSLTTAQGALRAAESAVRTGEIKVAALEELAEQYRGWEAAVNDLRIRETRLDLLVRAWHRDGVPTLILENALPAIEARANELLARMPGDFAVHLVTQRAKKVGGMIETLDVVVETEGQEREYDLLSGGERFRVDLALRVSLAELLTRRSARIATLWLDEPLAALDATGRDAVVASLAAIEDEFDLIVVVSHHDEFNDRFPTRIEVRKADGVSEATIAA